MTLFAHNTTFFSTGRRITFMKTWDIFCRVVDNYGDIGVCWRLARQLANEYPFEVRLWVDELEALTRIWPSVQWVDQQSAEGVRVHRWHPRFDENVKVADVVIEAFACELPESYVAAMAARKKDGSPPHWFNVEYLSAEPWVEDCHGLASMHPQTGLKKVFFFPGFTAKTGGLLCEKDLLTERDTFFNATKTATKTASKTTREWLMKKGINCSLDGLLISLFAYENNGIHSLLALWQASEMPITCLIPEGKILTSVNNALGTTLKAGESLMVGQLQLITIPFLNQQEYDCLLWACDINFVRGEDSFVRAQWAAKPMIWHIYPQDDDAHIIKLNAFLDKYTQTMEPELAAEIRALWLAWNHEEDCAEAWKNTIVHYQNWCKHSQLWVQQLNSLGDLTSNMVQFCQKTL